MIIGIVNNKGGVLKTTISTNLAAALSLDNKKVIIVDLDGQGNVIATFGKNPFSIKNTVMNFLKGECNLSDCIIKQKNNLDILPGNDDLNFFDYYVKSNYISQSNLKLTIKKLNQIYDYVIIDTPPAMSTIVAIVLSINDVLLIPFEPDQYAVLGLKRIIQAAQEFKQKNNRTNMKILAVPTKVNSRVTIHNEIIEDNIRPKLLTEGIYVTKTFISSSTKSTASVGYEKVPIVFSVIKSKYQEEYKILKNEILFYIESNKSITEIWNDWVNKDKNDKNNEFIPLKVDEENLLTIINADENKKENNKSENNLYEEVKNVLTEKNIKEFNDKWKRSIIDENTTFKRIQKNNVYVEKMINNLQNKKSNSHYVKFFSKETNQKNSQNFFGEVVDYKTFLNLNKKAGE